MTRKRVWSIGVAVILTLAAWLTLHVSTTAAAIPGTRPAAAQARGVAAGDCAGAAVHSAPAYQDPDWWLGAIEYGFP